MADHLWFVPVTGGSRRSIESVSRPGYGGSDDTNVQWDFSVFPVNVQPRPDIACINMSSYNTFIQGDETPIVGTLRLCYGSWTWRSCASGDPLRIITGGQLMVGTVFSRQLLRPDPLQDLMWNTVDVWAKYRVLAQNLNVLSRITLHINDMSGNPAQPPAPPDKIPTTPLNQWHVEHAQKSGGWDGWDNENLRVILNFQGTTVPANVGLVTIDVEWFAIMLSDQVE